MRETPEELERLQDLLDRSYVRAGGHLVDIHTAEARLTAEQLVEALPWMQVAVVATVSADGRPFTGPIDAFLYRGALWFGTSAQALRARHLTANPAVSVTHVRGEGLVVTLHGVASQRPLTDEPGFLDHLRGHYGADFARYGLGDNPYYRVEADRLFAADMSVHQAG